MIFSKSPCLALLACLGTAAAQSIPPDEMHAHTVPYVPPSLLTLRTEVTVVEVPVVVRDSGRRAVSGLTRDDFELYDTGKKQAITAFSVQHFSPQIDSPAGTQPSPTAAATPASPKAPPRPRFIALCFDDLNVDSNSLKLAKDAAQNFVKTNLASEDRVIIVTTALSSDSEFTNDVPALLAQIAKVTNHSRLDTLSMSQCPRISPYEAYLIDNNFDGDVLSAKAAELLACAPRTPRPQEVVKSIARSIWEYALLNSKNTLRVIDSLVSGMAKAPGQRMILFTSGGFLTGNLEPDMEQLMTKALHAEVVINTLDAKGLYTIMPGGDASEPPARGRQSPRTQIVAMQTASREAGAKDDGMAVLAAGTGGSFYHNSNDLAKGFRELGMVPDTLYILGFTPDNVVPDGRFHSLKVRLAPGKHGSLQSRLGYNAPSPTPPPSAASSKLDAQLMTTATLTDLPARITWDQRPGVTGLTMVAHLDLNHLHFEMAKDRRAQKLTFVAMLLDSHGTFVAGRRSEMEINFTPDTFDRLAPGGLSVVMTLEAPAGAYTLRTAIEDSLDSKITGTSSAVEIK